MRDFLKSKGMAFNTVDAKPFKDVLQRSGVVRSEKVGRVRTCRLEPGPMRTLEQWIAEHRASWERHFDRLSDVLDDAFPTGQGDRR